MAPSLASSVLSIGHPVVSHGATKSTDCLNVINASMSMTAATSNALQYEELSPLHQLLRRLPLLDDAPPNMGVVVRVWHPHYPLWE